MIGSRPIKPRSRGPSRLTRTHRLSLAGLVFAAIVPHATAAEKSATLPNVIVIVADDLGYHDLGIQGSKEIPTPNIDSIAKGGIRFTSGYVSGPYCSPTRAGLMTGRYQQRYGHEFNPGPNPAKNFGLPLEEATLPEKLRKAGYSTGMVGKWHLGNRPEYHPLRRGFDHFFGFLDGAHSYLDWEAGAPVNGILRGDEPVDEDTYLTDAFARESLAFIDKHQKDGRPFFLYLAFNAVHNPLEATTKYRDRFASITDARHRTYAAMASAMDDAVGQVLNRLRERGIEENTLIVFISDNGGPAANTSNNHPLRGYKAQTLEGGIRVPCFIRWKGHLPEGKTYEEPVIQLDIHTTALAAAGIDVTSTADNDRPLDGVNLLPYLKGEKNGAPHDALYWRFGQQWAIRKGDWKLVRHAQSNEVDLYNLREDISESKNLAAEESQKASELKAAWDQWNKGLVEPSWTPNTGAAAKTARAAKKRKAQ